MNYGNGRIWYCCSYNNWWWGIDCTTGYCREIKRFMGVGCPDPYRINLYPFIHIGNLRMADKLLQYRFQST